MASSRWLILAALFAARAAIGFQYQSVASALVSLRDEAHLSLDQIGVLLGIYFSLGIALALPSGAIGARFGSKHSVLVGLALMTLGGLAEAKTQSFGGHLAARILAGTGGVLVNVMMTKMVTDWFAGARLPTAMGIFVSSWPFGVAVGLIADPWLIAHFALESAFFAGAAWAAIGFLAVAAIYRAPPAGAGAPVAAAAFAWPRGTALACVVLAGLMWGWFNAGFAMIFGFGPAALIENGLSAQAAGALVSVVLWTSMISVPLGGFVTDKSGRSGLMIVVSPLFAGLLILITAWSGGSVLGFTALGLVLGIPAGAIIALPAQVLAPKERAIGAGIFFSLFYLVMVLAPIAAGAISAAAGTSVIAYQSGALCMLIGVACYAGFVWLRPRTTLAGVRVA